MRLAFVAIILLLGNTTALFADPTSLVGPRIYDNQGGGVVSGQLFVSESEFVSGVRWYIGDPTRPTNPKVDSLQGPADLVLYDAANVNLPLELRRTQVQGTGGITNGFTTFSFSAPISVLNGHVYFIGLQAADLFGIGVGQQHDSTYGGGYEAILKNGQIMHAASNPSGQFPNAVWRDTTFEILNLAPTADYNRNGIVDAADYVIWRRTLGQLGFGLAADGNGDGKVSAEDYIVWKTHFGQTVGIGTLQNSNLRVPEPRNLQILVLGMCTLTARVRHGQCSGTMKKATTKFHLFKRAKESCAIRPFSLRFGVDGKPFSFFRGDVTWDSNFCDQGQR